MQKWRSDAEFVFKTLFDEANSLSLKLNTNISMPRNASRQIKASELNIVTPEKYYRIFLFIPLLEKFISELEDRFRKHNDLLRALQKFIPRRCFDLFSLSELTTCTSFYSKFLPNPEGINEEFELWKQKWSHVNSDNRPNTAIDALSTLQFYTYVVSKYLEAVTNISNNARFNSNT